MTSSLFGLLAAELAGLAFLAPARDCCIVSPILSRIIDAASSKSPLPRSKALESKPMSNPGNRAISLGKVFSSSYSLAWFSYSYFIKSCKRLYLRGCFRQGHIIRRSRYYFQLRQVNFLSSI